MFGSDPFISSVQYIPLVSELPVVDEEGWDSTGDAATGHIKLLVRLCGPY